MKGPEIPAQKNKVPFEAVYASFMPIRLDHRSNMPHHGQKTTLFVSSVLL